MYHAYYGFNGGQFYISSFITLSVSQLLTVIQCAYISEGQKREVGTSCYHGSVLLDCLMSVNSVKSVSDSQLIVNFILL